MCFWWRLMSAVRLRGKHCDYTHSLDLVTSSSTLIEGIVHQQGCGGTQLTDVRLVTFWDVNL